MTKSRNLWSFGAALAVGASSLVAPSGLGLVRAHDMPPARPGECYGRVVLPPVYGKVSKQVLEQAAWSETRTVPPVVQKIERKVLVKPERVERVQTPAVYKDQISWVTKPGVKRTVTEPARYKVVSEKVLVEEARTEWRRVDAPLAYGETRSHQTLLQATGEVYCNVLIPARYEYVERKVQVAPARTREVVGPPRKVKVVEKVLVREAGWVERKVPAVYRTEVTRKVVKPAREEVVHHPAVYRTVEMQALVKGEAEGWALVVCGGAINPAFMALVQQALVAAGYDAGPPDGYARPETYAALQMFQRDHGLARGQLTVETARALRVL